MSRHEIRPDSPEHGHHHGGAGHTHGHGNDVGTVRLVLAIVFNLLISVAEFVAGVVSGSLALLADAAHNLSDTASMGVSLIARRVAGREPDERRTFGYERAELIGAFVNLITLVLIGLYLLVEAAQRAADPREIDGSLMLIVGAVTLAGNVATALVLYKPSRGSLNVGSAFAHIVADALGSVAVIVGGWVVVRYGWTLIDPILTAGIALYILVHSYRMLRETVAILMESVPEGFPLEEMTRSVREMEHVRDVHHVHVWRLDERRVALEAHVAVEGIEGLGQLDVLRARIKGRLAERFGVGHATLEMERTPCAPSASSACYDPSRPPSERRRDAARS